MHILMIGCGRSGRHLAELLLQAGLELVLIDEDPAHLATLDDLNAVQIQGHPIDIEILEKAGIQDAAAVIALDDRENINIMCCQIAHKLYGIQHVIARTFTPENENFVHSLGLSTICSTNLTVNRALSTLGFKDGFEGENE